MKWKEWGGGVIFLGCYYTPLYKKRYKKEKQSKEDYFKIKWPAGAFEYEEVNFRKKLGPI